MKGENYMDHARQFASRMQEGDNDFSTLYGSVKSGSGRPSSVASLGSGLAQQAKTIVNSMNSFNCGSGINERSQGGAPGGIPFTRSRSTERSSVTTERSRTPSTTRTPSSKLYKGYSRSPQRIDV
jgi:hypothetical protein